MPASEHPSGAASPEAASPEAGSADAPPRHVPGAYALAQALTPDAVAAARLVAAAYRAAPGRPAPDRLALYRALLHAHVEGVPPAVPDDTTAATDATGFRQRAVDRFLREAMPLAFAALPPRPRALLVLCKVEQLSCADAGHVLGLTPDQACAALDDACAALRAALLREARPGEQSALRAHLSGPRLQRALQHFAAAELATPSAALTAALVETRAARAVSPDDAGGRASGDPPADRPARRLPRVLRGERLRHVLTALLLIVLVGAAGYAAAAFLSQPPERDLVTLTARHEASVDPSLDASTPAQAERRVQELLGRRLALPAIDSASFEGLRLTEIAPGARVPVFLYTDDATGQPLRLYAYTYALLGRHAERLRLDESLLRQLEEAGAVRHVRAGGRSVLLWRSRDDIFLAVTPARAASLRERLSF